MSTPAAPPREHERPRATIALLCAGCVLALLAWPLVHFAWSTASEADPWKLGGWAMYATPSNHVEVAVLAGRRALPADRIGPCLGVLDRFVARRKALGRGVQPVELLRCVRRLEPAASAVRVRALRLDGASGRVVERVDSYP